MQKKRETIVVSSTLLIQLEIVTICSLSFNGISVGNLLHSNTSPLFSFGPDLW